MLAERRRRCTPCRAGCRRGVPPGRAGRAGRRLRRRRATTSRDNALGTAHPAQGPAPCGLPWPARAGLQHGRLRRGRATPARSMGACAPGDASAYRPRGRPVRAAVPALRADRSSRALVDETAPLDPRNVYAATKVHQEHLGWAYAAATGADVVRCATTTCTGRGCRATRRTPASRASCAARARAGVAPRVFEDGAAAPRLRPRDRRRGGQRAGPHGEPSRSRAPTTSPSGEVCTIAEMADAVVSAYAGRVDAPVVTGEFRVGDVRHITRLPGPGPEALRVHRRASPSARVSGSSRPHRCGSRWPRDQASARQRRGRAVGAPRSADVRPRRAGRDRRRSVLRANSVENHLDADTLARGRRRRRGR